MREASYVPLVLTLRQRTETALISVVQRTAVNGISTRKIEVLAQELGIKNLDKSTVSCMCTALDEYIHALRTRRIDIAVPYLFLDATSIKVRQNHRIVSYAVFVAVGLDAEETRRILDVMVSAGEDVASWECFGLARRPVMTSDAHKGIQAAIQTVCVGSSWQRRTIHVIRNVLSHISHRDKRAVAARCRTMVAQTTRADARR